MPLLAGKQRSACEISLHSFSSRTLSNLNMEDDEEAESQLHSYSRSSLHNHIMVDDLNCNANARHSSMDMDDGETNVKLLDV